MSSVGGSASCSAAVSSTVRIRWFSEALVIPTTTAPSEASAPRTALEATSTEDPPIVILTSNRTREVHDAQKPRCLYHWVDYPDFDREMEILRARAPEAEETLSREVVAFVQRLRSEDLFKRPGVAETIDWANALRVLGVSRLDKGDVEDTLGVVLKYREDVDLVLRRGVEQLVAE